MNREMRVIQNIREDKGLEVSYEWIESNQEEFNQIEFIWTEYS